jgi:hypothetical protein
MIRGSSTGTAFISRSSRALSRIVSRVLIRPVAGWPWSFGRLTWMDVVILDHAAPPEGVLAPAFGVSVPVVAILRRDWDFLFDHLRSVSASSTISTASPTSHPSL